MRLKFIAEMSANHNGSLERALKIAEMAAGAGCFALKLQTYTPEEITMDPELKKIYEVGQTPREWHKEIFNHCKVLGIRCFSSPFSVGAVDFLEQFEPWAYKISSFEVGDLELVKAVAKTKRNVVMSIGMASKLEIQLALDTLREYGASSITLLKCTSAYPAPVENMNLTTLLEMKRLYKTEVGISDHNLSHLPSLVAISLGATMVEKHFTLKRSDGGIDSMFSIEPGEMVDLIAQAGWVEKIAGKVHFGPTPGERVDLKRSLHVIEDLKKGDTLGFNNVKALRPAGGLAPKTLYSILGAHVNKDVSAGSPLTIDMIEFGRAKS